MSATDRKLRVFLCHSSQDKPIVRELYTRLLSEGWIDPWLDEEKLLPGQDWDMEIEKAVEVADVVIVCLSNQSVTKEGYVQRELRFVLDIALQKPEGTIFMIPLKLENCELPRKLRTLQYVDYFPLDKRETSFRLLKASMQERLKNLGLYVSADHLENSSSSESLSSKIISKKIFDARQALQNDRLQNALEIYEVLIRQRLRLKEIISDLEDVSIIFPDSSKLWATLASAYRMNGDISRANEYEIKINDHDIDRTTVGREPEIKGYQEGEKHNLDNQLKNEKSSASVNFFLPFTISIETLGGLSTPIFYKGDSLPSEFRNTFSTAADNQSQVELHLVIGENRLAGDNRSIGKCFLDGISPAPKGIPQIEIIVKVSRELELNVMATEKATGRTKNLQVVKLDTITPPPTKDPLPPKSDSSSVEDLFGSGGFSDFFQTIFGVHGAEAAIPVQAKEYQQPLEISMEEAYKGTTHLIQNNDKQKLVRIPAGVRTGSKVRVAGAGPNGRDLYFIISVKPHLFFSRTGSDLFLHYPVSKTLAQHGGELHVPLVEKGTYIVISIPPKTKDKQVFRFANKGFPNVKEPTKFGDFYLTVDLYDPQKMPQEFKELLDNIKNHIR